MIAGLLVNLINGITTGMGVYYCRDLFGNADIYALVTLALLLPTIFFLPLAVVIAKKIGHHKTLVYGRIGYMIGIIVEAVALFKSNLVLFFVGIIVCGVFGATFAACFTARLANICDYGEWKYHTNASGIMMSATSFCNKIGLGLGAASTGIILEIAKYNGAAAAAGIAQSAYTITVERLVIALLPLVLNAIVTVCLYLCNVDPVMEQIKRGLEK